MSRELLVNLTRIQVTDNSWYQDYLILTSQLVTWLSLSETDQLEENITQQQLQLPATASDIENFLALP